MTETNVNKEIQQTFSKLKLLLADKKCRILSEENLSRITVVQGSLWGTSPKTAQKKTTYLLRETSSGTNIKASSSLTRSYLCFTLVGVAFSVALMIICFWIALNLRVYIDGGAPGVWGWLVQVHGFLDLKVAQFLETLGWALGAFLAISLVVEGVIIARVLAHLELFSKEILAVLSVSE